MTPVLQAEALTKSYGEGALAEPVLRGASLTLAAGETAVLLGPSGSGKTTLLSILGGLLAPTGGTLALAGRPVDFSDPEHLGELRRTHLGFVFQHAQLLPFLTVEENLALVARNAGMTARAVAARIATLLDQLGLSALRDKRPGQLSGGQRQRVAIARALLHEPAVVLADEPTAALDWTHGSGVIDLLVTQARQAGSALLVVTHDTRLIPRFDRVFAMAQGCLVQPTSTDASHAT